MGYSKQLMDQKKISEWLQTAPLTILNFLLTIKISYFLFFT